MTKTLIALALLLLCLEARATTPVRRTIDVLSATGGSGLNVPTTGTSVSSDTNSQTFQNKGINCSSNTCSQLPVATQTIQVVVTPAPNGSTTAFTLSTAPGAGAGVVCYLDGAAERQGSGKDYTISGSVITFSVAPHNGQDLYCVYSQY